MFFCRSYKGLFIYLLYVVLGLTQCDEATYIDVAPQLEITVVDASGKSIEGAIVRLYKTAIDLGKNQNQIGDLAETNQEGKVLLSDLEEVVYYFYIVKDNLDNVHGIVTFKETLQVNQIRFFTVTLR